MELELKLRQFIVDNLVYLDEGFEYGNDTSLIGEGLIDSVGTVELVEFVQTAFGITLQQEDVKLDNFDSITKIAALVRHKLAEADSAKWRPGLLLSAVGDVARQ